MTFTLQDFAIFITQSDCLKKTELLKVLEAFSDYLNETHLHPEIAEARKVLIKHGYKVEKS